MKDKTRYCPIPYAITEITMNRARLKSEAGDCVPRRLEIRSSEVSTINAAITITAIIRIDLFPTFGDDDIALRIVASYNLVMLTNGLTGIIIFGHMIQ